MRCLDSCRPCRGFACEARVSNLNRASASDAPTQEGSPYQNEARSASETEAVRLQESVAWAALDRAVRGSRTRQVMYTAARENTMNVARNTAS